MNKEQYGEVYAAGGAELVAYTEFREHIKFCDFCEGRKFDDNLTCKKALYLFDKWQQKKLLALQATLEATGDLTNNYH